MTAWLRALERLLARWIVPSEASRAERRPASRAKRRERSAGPRRALDALLFALDACGAPLSALRSRLCRRRRPKPPVVYAVAQPPELGFRVEALVLYREPYQAVGVVLHRSRRWDRWLMVCPN
jgi:hypothetical protein